MQTLIPCGSHAIDDLDLTIEPSTSTIYNNIDFTTLTPENDIGEMQLGDAYHRFVINEPVEIPLSVRLIENPKSPFAFPGSISLQGHDYIHLLLNRGASLFDEGFVVGFTMGNCTQLKPYHISIYKVFAKMFFPKAYQFNALHLKAFDLGVMYGQKLPTKNIHTFNFEQYSNVLIRELRMLLKIDLSAIYMLWETEFSFSGE